MRILGLLLPLLSCAEETRPPLLRPPPGSDTGSTHDLEHFEHRAVMVVVDLSQSMLPEHVDRFRDGTSLLLERLQGFGGELDMMGIVLFASRLATRTGGTDEPGDDPWATLMLVHEDGSILEERITGICAPEPGCTDPTASGPTIRQIGAMTNGVLGIEMATHQLTSRTDAGWRRAIVLATGGYFNEYSGTSYTAEAISDHAWLEHEIEIWPIHLGSYTGGEIEEMARGGGLYQQTNDAAELPEMFIRVADAMEPLYRSR